MRRLIPFLAAGLFSTPAFAATVLHCGTLVDVRAGRILTNMTVVVDGPTIRRVEQGFTNGARVDDVVDLRTHTCMPGLIDTHVHLTD
jgi:imidazolonepropionase-like amidohydrolase